MSGPLAGALVTFSVLGDVPPAVGVLFALALGAPVAGGVHAVAATTRIKTTVASGGALNPVVSVAEDGLSVGAIVIALLAPILAVVFAMILLFLASRFLARRSRRSRTR